MTHHQTTGAASDERGSPCVIFALRRESTPFRRLFSHAQRIADSPWAAWQCSGGNTSALLLETGVGAARTAQALDWLLEQRRTDHHSVRPGYIVAAGFCGALDPSLKVGDLVLATQCQDQAGRCYPTTWPRHHAGLEAVPGLHVGAMLTMPHLVTGPSEKQALGRRHAAIAVDMESAVIARRCAELRIPYACLRAVSDRAATALSPALVACLQGATVVAWRLASLLIRSPHTARELVHLARATRHAGSRLAQGLADLLAASARGVVRRDAAGTANAARRALSGHAHR